MTNQDFNDPIDFGGDDLDQVLAAPARVAPTQAAVQVQTHRERCWKCGGTGQTRWGTCYACNGKGGRDYKQPAAVRAKAREQAWDRKVRTNEENVRTFKTAYPAEWAWSVDLLSDDSR
jgi:Tfp pilus assembly protein FimT